jgi:hypothetical protein
MFDTDVREVDQLARQREAKKAQVENACAQSAGRLSTSLDIGARPSLIDRVRVQMVEAEAQCGRASRLAELNYLLEKHPDVARILDLVESVR